MDIFTIIIICLTALVVAGMAFGIANLARSVDRIETVQSREIEAFTLSKKNLDGRIDEVIKSENAWHSHIENKLKTTDVEIDAITAKMAEIAKDCGRWDEIDTRIRIADAKAAEAQRMMILNGLNAKENSGVPWAKYQVCMADQEESDEQSV